MARFTADITDVSPQSPDESPNRAEQASVSTDPGADADPDRAEQASVSIDSSDSPQGSASRVYAILSDRQSPQGPAAREQLSTPVDRAIPPDRAARQYLNFNAINSFAPDRAALADADAFNGIKSRTGFENVQIDIVDPLGNPLNEVFYLAARDGVPPTASRVIDAQADLSLQYSIAHTDFVGLASYSQSPHVDYAWYSVPEQAPIIANPDGRFNDSGTVVLQPATIQMGDLYPGTDPLPVGGGNMNDNYVLRLELGDNSIELPAGAVSNPAIDLEHTALSSWSIDLPYSLAAETWVRAQATIRYGDRVLMRGYLDSVNSNDDSGITTLEGRGPLAILERGGRQVAYTNKLAHVAIEEYWRDYTPFFDSVSVRVPDIDAGDPSPVILDSATYAGSHFENLQQLHKDAGYRWAVQITNEGIEIDSFPPGAIAKESVWTTISRDRNVDATDYANSVTAYGGEDSDGTLVLAETVEDSGEIERVGDVIKSPPVIEPKITDRRALRAVANRELRTRTRQDNLSGSVSIVPKPIPPGYHYKVPEFGDALLALESTSFGDGMNASGTLNFETKQNLATELARSRDALRSARLGGGIGGGGGPIGGAPGDGDDPDGGLLSGLGIYGGGVYGDSTHGG